MSSKELEISSNVPMQFELVLNPMAPKKPEGIAAADFEEIPENKLIELTNENCPTRNRTNEEK
ncbi:hypothetical protein DCC81_23955 [Chitinophaga parva]|uniref:Uncharacterized protein n=2 Tax=Chitinophaga parva TaxID=2169414 RepID=A0A2T7BEA6_9BACT|nr:hypothetical protein DCC81_23955 [Chitinophaga parva]